MDPSQTRREVGPVRGRPRYRLQCAWYRRRGWLLRRSATPSWQPGCSRVRGPGPRRDAPPGGARPRRGTRSGSLSTGRSCSAGVRSCGGPVAGARGPRRGLVALGRRHRRLHRARVRHASSAAPVACRRARARWTSCPALAAVASVAAVRSWAFATGAREALVVLLPGVDNVAHFQIFTTMRAYGAILTRCLRRPEADRGRFTGYPAGFHSTVASAADLLDPGAGVGPDALALYTRSVAVVIVLGATVLAAAVASLPRLEDRPWVCAVRRDPADDGVLVVAGAERLLRRFRHVLAGCPGGWRRAGPVDGSGRSGWSLRNVAVVGLCSP